MIIDNLADRRNQARGLALLVACLAIFSTGTTTLANPVGWPASVQLRQFLDPACNNRPQLASIAAARGGYALLTLKCDVMPLYNQYLAQYHNGQVEVKAIGGSEAVAREFNELRTLIDGFFEQALDTLGTREFCSYVTFANLQTLRGLTKGNRILELIYDMLAMDQHTHCLGETIANLPAVPYLVKDIVKIYIDGADTPIPDLNDPAPSDMDLDDDTPFDVDAAIAKNGKLEQVCGLSLSMFGRPESNSETARKFRETCQKFVTTIEHRWEGMQMMSDMTATESNAIKQMNNYALRTLAPTKFADICSRISGYRD